MEGKPQLLCSHMLQHENAPEALAPWCNSNQLTQVVLVEEAPLGLPIARYSFLLREPLFFSVNPIVN